MGRVIENIGFFGRPVLPELVEDLLHSQLVHGMDLQEPLLGSTETLVKVVAEARRDSTALALPFETVAQTIEELFAYDGSYWNSHLVIRVKYLVGLACPWGDFATTSPLCPFDLQVREILLVNRERIFDFSPLHERYSTVDALRGALPDLVRRDEVMVFSELHPHLLRAHHFPEGRSTPYRTDFVRAKRYLGL